MRLIINDKMIKTFFISLFIVAAGANTYGQQTEDIRKEMTLRDCMIYAISNSTKMRIQQAAIGDARIARRDAALALFTPQIDANTYAYYNFGRSIDPQTNTYFTTTSFHNNYGISVGYNLFDGFQAVNNYKISKTGMLIAKSEQKQVEADICLAVMEAYYNVVYYKRLTDVYQEQVAAAEESLKLARRQEELGQKGYADVIQMEAELADRQYDLINTHNMYLDQKTILSDLMFWPEDEELLIPTNLDELSTSQTNSSSVDKILGVTEADAQSVVDFALAHNPEVEIATWQQQNAKRELNTAKWQVLPTVGLYAGWNTSYYSYQGSEVPSFRHQFRNNRGEYIQMSVSIPLWDRMSRASKISNKRNAYKKATAELDQKRRDVESEVRRAIQDRNGSATAYQQAQRKAEVQNEAYQLNLKKLEQGLISPLEFQTATGNYLKAQADEMNSLFTFLIKEAVVNYYNGIEYIEQ